MAKSTSGTGDSPIVAIVECAVCKLRVPLNWLRVCQSCWRVYSNVLALRLHHGAVTTETPEKWIDGSTGKP